ncbi:MAG TPA: penicillin-binding protein 2 [Gammaproteobacteria bacterium]|nr:penicillin-binding protein 2 [Gammaproteobacteria bacterium]
MAFIAWRFYFALGIIAVLISALLCRVVYLTLIKQSFLRNEGNARTIRVVDIPAFRGMIVDRNGNPLAVSAEVFSVWTNPQEFTPSVTSLRFLHKNLAINPTELQKNLAKEKAKGREFSYLKRGIEPEVAEKLKQQTIPGLYLQREYKRFYPEGEIMAHILGFTNIDDRGQEGLELAYNDWLQGVPGKKVVVRDRLGHVVSDIKLLQDQKPGKHLTLSIDRRIQYLAYRELMAGVQENKARSGTVVVLDAKTGEILGMANYPSFNPNHRQAGKKENYRNIAITDVYEPGSTIKAFSIACALDSGKFKPDTVIDTYPGWIKVGHNVIHDISNYGAITVSQVVQKSSDVGTTKMVLTLPPERLWELLHKVGFGELTGVEFPGEQPGSLVKHPVWSPFVFATMSFGYGMSVTPLQLARAYSVLANEGAKMPVTLLKKEDAPSKETVMEPRIAKQMLSLLELVVGKGGTGSAAQVPGFRVAGKTGTAKIAGVHGYQEHRYESSFVGIAPVSNPALVIVVVLHDPQGKHYYGGEVAAPIFSRIMEGALRIMNVEPDAV